MDEDEHTWEGDEATFEGLPETPEPETL